MAGKKTRKVKRALLQAKEPLSLLETLKEEGVANAMLLLSMASGAAKNFKVDSLKPQVKEFLASLDYAKRTDLEKLESRIEELEDRLTEIEGRNLRDEE